MTKDQAPANVGDLSQFPEWCRGKSNAAAQARQMLSGAHTYLPVEESCEKCVEDGCQCIKAAGRAQRCVRCASKGKRVSYCKFPEPINANPSSSAVRDAPSAVAAPEDDDDGGGMPQHRPSTFDMGGNVIIAGSAARDFATELHRAAGWEWWMARGSLN